MQGNNVAISIYRAPEIADDEAGGAQRGSYALVDTARGRLDNRAPTLEMRAQGLSTDKLFDAVVKPATSDVQENDLLVPTSGPFALQRFLVTSVQKPSMATFSSARAHLRLQLERWDDGKLVEGL